MNHHPYQFKANIYWATLYQLAIALLMLWLTRFFFVAYNWDKLEVGNFANLLSLSFKGLRFDLSALAYFNCIFIAMRILPLPWSLSRAWLRASTIVYGISNGIILAINIFDTPYYDFTGARLRWSNVVNIFTDSGIGAIAGGYIIQYIGIVTIAIAAIAILMIVATRVKIIGTRTNLWYRVLLFILFGGITFVCMRGRVGSGIPLSIADAAFMVDKPQQINAVLNSPFCLLRSTNLKRSNYEKPLIFFSDSELNQLRQSLHTPSDSAGLKKRNYMTIIIESGGAEWVDSLTVGHRDNMPGLMPFLDSIASLSVNFSQVSATGMTSLGGTTALLGCFPAFDPFYYMLSPYNKNNVDTPAHLLSAEGWSNAFFYGVKHGSFNIDQTAYAMGYTNIYNRDRYNNNDDFDGHWGIFDIPMAEYTVNELSLLPQPFIAVWFTISSHGPFTLPDGYDTSSFRHKEVSPERGLEYTDRALRRFFELAKEQPWYDNTTFIITADHGNRDFSRTKYGTDYVRNRIPFLIFTPDGSLTPRKYDDRMLSQFDIPATLMALSGYDKPYIMLGANAFDDNTPHFGIYRGDGGIYFITADMLGIYTDAEARRIDRVYSLADDPFLEHPLEIADSAHVKQILTNARAFLQDYTTRLNEDRLSVAR